MEKIKKLFDTLVIWGIFLTVGIEVLLFFFGTILTIAVLISLPFGIMYFVVWFLLKILAVILTLF